MRSVRGVLAENGAAVLAVDLGRPPRTGEPGGPLSRRPAEHALINNAPPEQARSYIRAHVEHYDPVTTLADAAA